MAASSAICIIIMFQSIISRLEAALGGGHGVCVNVGVGGGDRPVANHRIWRLVCCSHQIFLTDVFALYSALLFNPFRSNKRAVPCKAYSTVILPYVCCIETADRDATNHSHFFNALIIIQFSSVSHERIYLVLLQVHINIYLIH